MSFRELNDKSKEKAASFIFITSPGLVTETIYSCRFVVVKKVHFVKMNNN